MSLNFICLFSITVFIASIIPGPSMLLALTHGMQYGAKKTLASAMGNVTVTLIQASISIAGIGTVLIASETVFRGVKWAGAAYLIYLGLSLIFSSKLSLSNTPCETVNQKHSLRKMYLQAAVVTAGNPKAIIFFSAVFPQFMNPNVAFLPQFTVLIGICTILAFTCFMIYAVSGEKIVSFFSDATIGKSVNRLIGGTFIGAGIGLAASNR